jgi:hypothetical protein
MSEKPISPLRQRMIEDMSVRNFVEKTRSDYIRHVCTFTAFLGRSPATAGPEDPRRFQKAEEVRQKLAAKPAQQTAVPAQQSSDASAGVRTSLQLSGLSVAGIRSIVSGKSTRMRPS